MIGATDREYSSVRPFVGADGTEVILAVLGPGEVVGEMSVSDSLGRSARA